MLYLPFKGVIKILRIDLEYFNRVTIGTNFKICFHIVFFKLTIPCTKQTYI